MSGAIDAVGGVIGKAAGAVGGATGLGALGSVAGGLLDLGGDGGTTDESSSKTQKNTLGAETNQDVQNQARANSYFDSLGQFLGQNSQEAAQNASKINGLFRDALVNFVSGGGAASPEQVAQATSYVDQTFTIPATQQYKDFLGTLTENTQARAAAQGRSSLDSALNNQIVTEGSKKANELAQQRGSLIAQRASDQQINSLNQLYNASNFFNTPLNQAINNRLGLLNANTAQQQLGLNARIAGGSSSTNGSSSSTAPGASMGSQIAGLGSNAGNALYTYQNKPAADAAYAKSKGF